MKNLKGNICEHVRANVRCVANGKISYQIWNHTWTQVFHRLNQPVWEQISEQIRGNFLLNEKS